MHDAAEIILGAIMSFGIVILLPLYFIGQETRAREAKEREQDAKKSDCP